MICLKKIPAMIVLEATKDIFSVTTTSRRNNTDLAKSST